MGGTAVAVIASVVVQAVKMKTASVRHMAWGFHPQAELKNALKRVIGGLLICFSRFFVSDAGFNWWLHDFITTPLTLVWPEANGRSVANSLFPFAADERIGGEQGHCYEAWRQIW